MTYKSEILAILTIVLGITQVACVPPIAIRETDNPFEKLTQTIVPGKSTSLDVHKALGEPDISLDQWGIEVYSKEGHITEHYVPIPVPSEGRANYFALVVYDRQGTLKAFGSCAEMYGFACRAADAGMYGHLRAWNLLAPLDLSHEYLAMPPEPNECVLLLFPSDADDSVTVDDIDIGSFFAGNTYLRLRLAPGSHDVQIFHKFRSVEYYGSEWLYCEAGKTFYMQRKRGGGFWSPKMELVVTETPPSELGDRWLVIRTKAGYRYGQVFRRPSVK